MIPLTFLLPQDSEGASLFTDGGGLAVLGGLCVLLAGVFQLSSMGRERAGNHLHQLLGTPLTSLRPLRGTMVAKARGQAVAVFLMLAALCLIGDRLAADSLPSWLLLLGVAVLVVATGLFLLLLNRYVDNHMRRHLRQHPFSFEDHIALTREIGALFGMPSTTEDTLESYVRRLREKLALPEAPRRVDRLRVPPL
ncbi:MAG: hypothetical protein ACPGQD_05210 [Planctomycetota bacterium]